MLSEKNETEITDIQELIEDCASRLVRIVVRVRALEQGTLMELIRRLREGSPSARIAAEKFEEMRASPTASLYGGLVGMGRGVRREPD